MCSNFDPSGNHRQPKRGSKLNTQISKSKARIITGALVFFLVLYVFPFFMVLINSFKTKRDIVKTPLSLIGEKGLIFSNFEDAIQKMDFFTALGNSVIITCASVLFAIIFSALAGYYFARTKSKIGRIIFVIIIASMAVPFQVLMIPIVSIYGKELGLLNHRSTLVFMHIGFNVSMGIFIYRNAIISTVPLELEEAAKIDGCSRLRSFISVVFPILKPSSATLIIIFALNVWNDYLLPSLVLGEKRLFTLPVATRVFYGSFSSDYGLIMASLVMIIIPILVVYVFLQKYIIEGVVAGAVKG